MQQYYVHNKKNEQGKKLHLLVFVIYKLNVININVLVITKFYVKNILMFVYKGGHKNCQYIA